MDYKHQMTLVLVETTKGSRFGGFTTKIWDGNCVKKIDNNAFAFSIDKHKIYDIRKNEYEYAIIIKQRWIMN